MKSKEIAQFRKTYKAYKKQCHFEGLKLAVHFDEKDGVKKEGAQWNQDGKFWWMPEKHLTRDVHPGIGTVQDWLNDNKMIVGPYGKFIKNDYTVNLFDSGNNHEYTEYGLHKSNNDPQFKVQFFFQEDVAKFIPTGMGDLETEYYTKEDGQKRWNECISNGYNRVVENS
jgi:hypothetical protein